MSKTSPDVDRYIAKAAPFAQPILTKIRKAFHKASPEIVETMKWSFPHFDYKGMLGSMASFKQHVSWGFWKGKLMSDPHGILDPVGESSSMGGTKVTKLSELPSEKILIEYIREAMRLNDEGVKAAPRPRRAPAAIEIPADLQAALKKNAKAGKAFKAFTPGNQREYIEWITSAKQEATRGKRLAQAIEWIAEGKSLNWRYERK